MLGSDLARQLITLMRTVVTLNHVGSCTVRSHHTPSGICMSALCKRNFVSGSDIKGPYIRLYIKYKSVILTTSSRFNELP